MADEIELTLKSPTDREAPFTVKVERSQTIGNLKNILREKYPGRPLPEGQRMIYCGKLLKDDQLLINIFQSDTSAIVHFICQPSIDIEKDKNLNEMTVDIEKNQELYKEYQNYLKDFYSSSMQSVSSMDQYQQMMFMNHAYMQSYAFYYNQLNATQASSASGAPSTEVVQRTVTNENHNQENVPNNERQIAPVVVENRLPNMMVAAFGGLMGDGGEDENDGDVEQRDILHYFYMFVRFGLLVLICYYYSSMFSVVTTLMLFFLFFGVNFIRRNNHINQQIPILPAAEEVPRPPEEVSSPPGDVSSPPGDVSRPPGDVPDNSDLGRDNDNPRTSMAGDQVQTQEVSSTMSDRLRRVAHTSVQFVLTFFITLFPDPVAHINVN